MFNLRGLAAKIGAIYRGDSVEFQGASFDTRSLSPGNLFFAIRSERDGHDFVGLAVQKGAAAVVVDHVVEAPIPQVIVADTLKAFGEMAHHWRKQFSIPILALTGSCGKTTTKEMIASILRECGSVLASEGNFNNALGVPLSLFRLNKAHDFAVLEMGTNSPGEIAYIAHIAQPTVALITNIGASHLEKLGSFSGVSAEKSDIFTALPQDGVAVVNLDEPYASSWSEKIGGRPCITYGSEPSADVYFSDVYYSDEGVTFQLHLKQQSVHIAINRPGRHIVLDAVAAAAAAWAVGTHPDQIARGLSQVGTVSGRFRYVKLKNNTILIDDTYNASVSAVKNAIDTLAKFKGKKVFVMTNMGELGSEVEHYHALLGKWCHEAEFDAVFFYGHKEWLDFALQHCPKAVYFSDKISLLNAVKPLLTSETMVLVKGAHSHAMDTVVAALIQEGGNACGGA